MASWQLSNIEGLSPERIPFCDFSSEASVVFVFPDKIQAEHVFSILQLTQLDHEIILLDFFDSEIYETTFSDYEIFKKRASALNQILKSSKKIIVTTLESLNYLIPTPNYFEGQLLLQFLHSAKYPILET